MNTLTEAQAGTARHFANPASAKRTASSRSARVAAAMEPIGSSVTGLMSGSVAPSREGRRSPAMSSWCSGMVSFAGWIEGRGGERLTP